VINIIDLHLSYGDREVLKGVNLEINSGETVALLGSSGSGKSSLLRTLNRIHDLYSGVSYRGKIIFSGRNILSESENLVELRREIGMVFQKPVMFPLSIYENIAYGVKLQGEIEKNSLDEVVEKALQDSALWGEVKDRLHSPASELSGGQQQRLSIGRALAINPKVLLLDEPTSSLDRESTELIEDLIKELPITKVLVTHSHEQAQSVANRVYTLRDGVVVEN
jgi:phosphate transport system ATP-binding protein